MKAGFHDVDVSEVGDEYGTFTTPWGEKAQAVAGAEATLLTWGDTAITTKITTDPVRLAAKGASVGAVTFTAGQNTVTVPLVLSKAVTDPGPGWRLTHPGELF